MMYVKSRRTVKVVVACEGGHSFKRASGDICGACVRRQGVRAPWNIEEALRGGAAVCTTAQRRGGGGDFSLSVPSYESVVTGIVCGGI